MRRSALVVLAVTVALVGTACGADVDAKAPARAITRADDATCRVNQSSIEIAIEAYFAQETTYPPTLKALVPKYLVADPSDPALDPSVRATDYDPTAGTFKLGTACR